jgi:hypothetical protein
VLPPDRKAAIFDHQRRDSEVLAALALLTAAVADLPARRLHVRHASWAPVAVACHTAAIDPAPLLRTLASAYELDVPGLGPEPWGAVEVSACLLPACP